MHPPEFIGKLFKGSLIIFLLLSMTQQLHAQYYSTGQEASSIKWKQLKTEHVKLVFPDYYEQNARELAGYLDTVYRYASASLNYHPKRISLVLHTQSATSNALVAWAPKRIEFYTTPAQDMYAQPWLEQLSVHEYRHVVQIEKLNQGLTRVISWVFGQQGTAAILGLYVPPWFLEGDAVCTETGLSNTGRGRLPQFEMKLRAQLLEIGTYSYDKAVMGSYRNYTPNHYELGYFLVASGRKKYGTFLWEHSLDMAGRRPYMVTPFQKGIRDVSGLRKLPFYEECLLDLQKGWRVQDEIARVAEVSMINDDPRHYTDYRHPVYINDSTVLAMRSGLDDITRFISIDDEGNEKVLFTPGFLKTETLSWSSGKICWLESRPDLRWSNRSYTVIRVYELETKKTHTIRNKMRLFAPGLSGDGNQLVAVHVDSVNQYSLMIIDVVSGSIIKKIPTPANAFPMTPVWAGDDFIIAVLVSEEGKTIAKFDVGTGISTILVSWDYTDISQPHFHAPYIFYTAAWSGISNIYALNIEEGGIFSVTSSRFGALDASVSTDGNHLLFADYSSDGFRIVKQALDPDSWISLNEVTDQSVRLYDAIVSQENVVPPGSEIPVSDAVVKKYSRIKNLFNVHSWAPLDINASNQDISPGISVMSQNLLSSSFLTAGYKYDLNEEAGKVYGNYSYRGWYPIIDLYADYGLRRQFVYLPEKTEISWHETNLKAGLRLPLNLRRGKYYAGIQPSAYVNQCFQRMGRNADIFSVGYGLSMYRQIKSSYRDLYPKWGQSIGLYYRDTPLDQDNISSLAAGLVSLYFPGIIRHQGFNVYTGYQYRITGYYKFSDIVSYPRGISGMQDQELFSVRGTYAFPIAYPDWSIGPLVYMKRIRGALFYDYAVGLNPGGKNYYNSTGAELLTDVHILRFIAPLELGIRCIYLPDQSSVAWNFLFGIGFDSFYINREGVD
ncbi:MAG: hypothetical protein K8R63_11500 [Bacteroidales bacterium]|nr:hypothetical protein [Bacteroidales bacterium]